MSQCELQTTYQIGPPARPGSPAKGQGKVDGLSTAAARAPLDGSIELAERKTNDYSSTGRMSPKVVWAGNSAKSL